MNTRPKQESASTSGLMVTPLMAVGAVAGLNGSLKAVP